MTGRPPSLWADSLLALVAPSNMRDAVLGDLMEEYSIRARSEGPAAAVRWYWGQVTRSVPRLAWTNMSDATWYRTWGIAAFAWLLASIAEATALYAIRRLLPLGPQECVVHLAVGLIALALGGFVVARFRPAAALALAVLTALVVAGLMVKQPGSAPLWFQITFLMLGPAASLAGGAWSHRGQRVSRAW